ncbi:hypothetical protein EU527_08255 [Candidatus Thorarchaeota archaeon]|nr:MAG: hypothetical protein EU527_08255 [Candidatus Thorarchaeota archaeon]
MNDFYPVSPLVGITNTSYGAQVGVMNELWAVRVVRGKKILAEKNISDLDLENIVGIAYGHIRVEGLSRHAVATMSGRLMQFARQYQAAGVCPNYEIPDLSYDDGTTIGELAAAASGSPIASQVDESITTELHDMRVGEIPEIPRTINEAARMSVVESQASLICEISAYAATLPTGHLDLMFSKAADQLIHYWATSNPDDPSAALNKFGALIQSCSNESQMPKTGTGTVTIETGTCDILRVCRNLDPSMEKIPPGYPCAFHELIAKKLGELTGAKIAVNTSSTGCIVSMSLE